MQIKQPKTASAFLVKAKQLQEERGKDYDRGAERSFDKTAKAFSAITGKEVTGAEVALLLQILKDVRQFSADRFHGDSVEDCIAYASLKAELLYQQYEANIESDKLLV
jgi:hypothetical protein